MPDAEYSVQEAIYNALWNDAALGDLLAPNVVITGPAIYDHVPQADDSGVTAEFPYVVIGDDTSVEWDTDTETGHDMTVTIHVWSTQRGRGETKTILGAIYDALHQQTLSLSGSPSFLNVACLWEFSETLVESDGVTRHGVTRFRVVIEKET